MKIRTLRFITGTAAVALIAAVTLSAARPATVTHAQAATQVATSTGATNQCALIDLLVSDKPATPAATSVATVLPKTQVAIASTLIITTPIPTTIAAEGGAGEAGGGDEALTTYRDSKLKFSIGYPRSWSQDAAFKSGICFTGRDASIAVQYVPGAAPTDILAYVKADEANIKAQAAGYKAAYLKPSTEVRRAVILGYEWDAGKSSVTLKPVRARTDRYYFIDSIGRFVIISESAPINQFDPDGVRDTVLTYQAAT